MEDIKHILENQQEVKYLTYFCCQNKDDSVKLTLSTIQKSREYKFRSPNSCLQKLVDILFELKGIEKFMLKRILKEK